MPPGQPRSIHYFFISHVVWIFSVENNRNHPTKTTHHDADIFHTSKNNMREEGLMETENTQWRLHHTSQDDAHHLTSGKMWLTIALIFWNTYSWVSVSRLAMGLLWFPNKTATVTVWCVSVFLSLHIRKQTVARAIYVGPRHSFLCSLPVRDRVTRVQTFFSLSRVFDWSLEWYTHVVRFVFGKTGSLLAKVSPCPTSPSKASRYVVSKERIKLLDVVCHFQTTIATHSPVRMYRWQFHTVRLLRQWKSVANASPVLSRRNLFVLNGIHDLSFVGKVDPWEWIFVAEFLGIAVANVLVGLTYIHFCFFLA